MNPKSPRLIRMQEVRQRLGASYSQIYKLIRDGKLNAVRWSPRGARRFFADEVNDFIENLTTQGRNG